MALKVLFVADKFKGSLSAAEACIAMAAGWNDARPADDALLLPMSDGGDGFGEVLGDLIGARKMVAKTMNAAHLPTRTSWWWEAKSRTAIIESARTIGLSLLPPGMYHPSQLDSAGLAKLFEVIAPKEPKRIIIGVGGSATNDGGFGLLLTLGWRFLDKEGYEITRWTDLEKVERVEAPAHPIKLPEITVAVDVQNPLLGKDGATRVYGPQKGMRPEDMAKAEACLAKLAEAAKRSLKKDYAAKPGAGAAGGLGYGLMTFLNAKAISGFQLFAENSNLEARIKKADIVVTGEGSTDRSSVMGKGVGEVAKLAAKLKKPCVAISGRVDDQKELQKYFAALWGMVGNVGTLEASLKRPRPLLRDLAAKAASEWGHLKK
jgi:glycerate kinase